MKLANTVILLFLFAAATLALDPLLNEIETHLRYYEKDQAEEKFQLMFNKLQTLDNEDIAYTIFLYAKLLYLGQSKDSQNSLSHSLYFFKLAASLGSPSALFFTSLFSQYRLDGSLMILHNLEKIITTKNSTAFNKTSEIDESALLSLYQYVTERRNSSSLIDLYFSAQQGNSLSQIALGNKYMNGNGVKIDCRVASLYYKEAGSNEFLEKEIVSQKYQPMRLELQIYDMQEGKVAFNMDPDKLELLEQAANYAWSSVNQKDQYTIALSYLFGINGVRRDYSKAFEWFSKVKESENSTKSTVNQMIYTYNAHGFIGYLYLSGLGVKKDYQQAFNHFQKAADNNEPIGLNGLGYMYYHGQSVKQNIRLAIEYFKKSANLNDRQGLFNYGLIHMMPSTDDSIRDFNVAQDYIKRAAENNLVLAQYTLGLMYLDSGSSYQSCELSVFLMSSSLSNQKGNEYYNMANHLYQIHRYREAHLNYLIAGFLGDKISGSNSAILLDKHSIYKKSDLNFNQLQNELSNNKFYTLLQKNGIISSQHPYFILFEDLFPILGQQIPEINEQIKYVDLLLTPQDDQVYEIKLSHYVSYLLHQQQSNWSAYSHLQLGDQFYYGNEVNQNYLRAYKHYSLAAETNERDKQAALTVAYIKAQGYFNLAFMEQFGIGVSKNENNAEIFLNKSLSLCKDNLLVVFLLKYNLVAKMIHFSQIEFYQALEYITNYIWSTFSLQLKVLPFILIAIALTFFIGLRIRIKNQFYHDHHNHPHS